MRAVAEKLVTDPHQLSDHRQQWAGGLAGSRYPSVYRMGRRLLSAARVVVLLCGRAYSGIRRGRCLRPRQGSGGGLLRMVRRLLVALRLGLVHGRVLASDG
jgi:hypothetical protein